MVLRIAVVVAICCSSLIAQENYVVPILANSPHVFLGLTTEKDSDEGTVTSELRFPPREEGLPLGNDPHYEVAIYDTGAPATIISRTAFEAFDISGARLTGTEITGIAGAGGAGEVVDTIASDPMGTFVAGFDALLTNPANGDQVVDRSQLKGTITNSILYAADSAVPLPNLVGTNTSSFYTTVVDYGAPQIIEYNGQTYRSPATTLAPLGDLPKPDRRIQLRLEPGQLGAPALFPNVQGIGVDQPFNANPSFPTIAGTFWMRANVTNNDIVRNQLEFIFDTGAQGSFVSEQLAAEMGFDVIRDEPDFVVRIAGVTGTSEEVPGFYADEFNLPGTDGGLVLNNVPLIVFNVTDPRDATNTLDALIGMNLFANRALTINPQAGSPYLGISDPALIDRKWVSTQATDSWGAFGSWEAGGVPAIDWYADVTNVTGSPQTAVVSEDSTVTTIVAKGDSAGGTMTILVEQGITLRLFGNAIMQTGSTLHLDDATLDAVAVENRGGTLSGTGTFAGEVLSLGTIAPGGYQDTGTLNFSGSLDQLTQGTLHIELGDNSDPTDIQFDRVEVDGALSVKGKLELVTLDVYTQPDAGETDQFEIVTAAEQVFQQFEEFSFNDIILDTEEFALSSDGSRFRDHIENGQFITVSHLTSSVVVDNYQAVAGDTDGDGRVIFEDFLLLASNMGLEADWTGGDFTGDGIVGFPDFLALSTNFGDGEPASLDAAVPEPSAWGLTVVGCIAILGRRRRRFN